ncbi:MAG: hypothetical protein ACI9HB_002859 [Gammaproteobacteria bacterium]|jgi:hypothetical protein
MSTAPSLESLESRSWAMCREWRLRAQSVNSYFVLPVLAAQEMPHEREISCRSAAGEPDIDADCSEDERSNSQFADKPAARFEISNGRFQNIDS